MECTVQQITVPPEVEDERKDRGRKKHAGVTEREGRGGQGREGNEGIEKRRRKSINIKGRTAAHTTVSKREWIYTYN